MVGYEAIDLIAGLFFNTFGSPLVITAVIVGMLMIMLTIFKAPLSVMLVVIMPVIIGFVLNSAYTNLIEIPAWILIVVFLIAGFLFSLFFLFFVK